MTFYAKTGTSLGVGLWGVTPEEKEQGAFTQKSMNQFITLTQWKEPDPVAVWTKASGLFIPVLPDPSSLFICNVGGTDDTQTDNTQTGDTQTVGAKTTVKANQKKDVVE